MRIDISIKIKNLAIACEALSRVSGMADELRAVQNALNEEISANIMERYPPHQIKVDSRTNPDEEIPF